MTKNRTLKQTIRAYMDAHGTTYTAASEMVIANSHLTMTQVEPRRGIIPSISWFPKADGQTLFVASQEEATVLFSKIATIANDNPDEVDWLGIDLPRTMFGRMHKAHRGHLSLSLYETSELCAILEREVGNRKQGNHRKPLIVLIEKGDFLADVLTDKENVDDPMFNMIQPNLSKVFSEGAKVNIHVLMRVKEENVESWKDKGFTNTLVL